MLHIWESNYFFTDPSPIIVLYLQKLSFVWSIHFRRCWDLNVVTLAVEDANFALDCYVWSRFWSWILVKIFKLRSSYEWKTEVWRFWSCLVKILMVQMISFRSFVLQQILLSIRQFCMSYCHFVPWSSFYYFDLFFSWKWRRTGRKATRLSTTGAFDKIMLFLLELTWFTSW